MPPYSITLTIPAPAAVDLSRLLDAIALVETGGRWDGTPGAHGELSIYQLTLAAWRQHSGEPFAVAAANPDKARAVAMSHLRWLAGIMDARGLARAPAPLATAWHRGWSWTGRVDDYGERVANLYFALVNN